jgi:hypothetical protein
VAPPGRHGGLHAGAGGGALGYAGGRSGARITLADSAIARRLRSPSPT